MLPFLHMQMDHHFPNSDDLAQQHMISLTTHSADLLSLTQGDSYPLIIRLETLTEQAAAEGKQLQQVRTSSERQSALQLKQ